jgi:hypothetical protein
VLVYQSDHIVFDNVEVRDARGIGILFSGGDKGVTYSGVQNCKFENVGKFYIQSKNKKEERRQTVSFCCAPQDARGDYANQHNFARKCVFGYNGFDNLSLGQQSSFNASDNHFGGSHNGGTQAYGIQVRTQASVKRLFVTEDNRLFGNVEGPFGQQLAGFTAGANAALPCSLWTGDD